MKYKITLFLFLFLFSFSCENKNIAFLFALLNKSEKKINQSKQKKTDEIEEKEGKTKKEQKKNNDLEKDYPFKNYQIPKDTKKLSNGIPILNSDPNAVAQIYLDFTGGTEKKYSALKGIDLDGDPNTFNDEESQLIYQYWVEISSVFSMFDINVTTKLDPAKTRAWILITPSLTGRAAAEYGSYNMFSHATGTAALNWTAQGTGTAHEIGHIFGRPHAIRLDTQGNTVEGYIKASNFLRSSIMGGGGKTQTKWHNQYHDTNNQFKYSGDIEAIAGHIEWRVKNYLKCANGQYNFCPGRKKKSYPPVSNVHTKVLRNTDGYRPDDHQETFENATLIPKNSDGKWKKTGILEKHEDIDMFTFNWEGGNMILRTGSIALSPVSLKITLFNSSKQEIAGVDKQINHQFLNLKLPVGKYYLKLESRGFYSDIGLYQIHIQKTKDKWIAGYLGNLRNIEAIDFEDNEKKITMKGTPSFLWKDKNTSYDMMLYGAKRLSGNGSIKARINPKKWTNKDRFGIMIRNSMDPQSIFAAAIIGEKNYGGRLYYRLNNKGIATEKKKMSDSSQWVKITRQGKKFVIGFSKDNRNWVQETVEINMQNQVYIGLFASAQNGRIMNKVVFDEIETTGNFSESDLSEELTDPILTVNSTSTITINAGGNYDIERSQDGTLFEKLTTGRTYTDTGLEAGSRYFYRTRSGNRISAITNVTTMPKAVRPRFVTFYPPSSKKINLSSAYSVDSVRKPSSKSRGNFEVKLAVLLDWEEESFGATGYRIRRYATDGTLQFTQDIPQRRRKFVDLDVDFNTTYRYTITSLYQGDRKKEGDMISVGGTTPIKR